MQPLGDPVDEQVDDLELREVPADEGFVLLPQPLGDLAHRRAAQQAASVLIREQRLDVARREAARVHLHRQRLQVRRPAPRMSRIFEWNGSARSAICGALYSIAPSALFNRPVRQPLRYPALGTAPRA
jgi:hypothetical protein